MIDMTNKDMLIKQQHDFIQMALMIKMMIGQKTLRDEFAMAALTGLLQQGYDKFDPQEWSHQAYAYADSMMEARK